MDMQKKLQQLLDKQEMTEGSTAGESWDYLMAPWGIPLELVSYPNGKTFMNRSSVNRFDPR